MNKIYGIFKDNLFFWKVKTLYNWDEYYVNADLEFFRKYFRFFNLDNNTKTFNFPENLKIAKELEYEILVINNNIIFHNDEVYDFNSITVTFKNENFVEEFKKSMWITKNELYTDKKHADKMEEVDERIKISLW